MLTFMTPHGSHARTVDVRYDHRTSTWAYALDSVWHAGFATEEQACSAAAAALRMAGDQQAARMFEHLIALRAGLPLPAEVENDA